MLFVKLDKKRIRVVGAIATVDGGSTPSAQEPCAVAEGSLSPVSSLLQSLQRNRARRLVLPRNEPCRMMDFDRQAGFGEDLPRTGHRGMTEMLPLCACMLRRARIHVEFDVREHDLDGESGLQGRSSGPETCIDNFNPCNLA